MSIHSGVFIGDGSLVVDTTGDSVRLLRPSSQPHTVISGYRNIRFLTASRFGEYLAFWSDSEESFRLINLSGEEIWSTWMNTDKATPRGIQFSILDNSLVCVYDFEGVPGLFFCDIDNGYATRFGCSRSPVGYDAGLQYFAIDGLDPLEYGDERMALYELDAASGNRIMLTPAELSERIQKKPLIISRDRCIIPTRRGLYEHGWDAMDISISLNGFCILKNGSLHWIDEDVTSAETEFKGWLQKYENESWHQINFSVQSDYALVHSLATGSATIIHRHDFSNYVWQGEECSSVNLRYLPYMRLVARYNDGTVSIKLLSRTSESIEHKYAPPEGYDTVAADITFGWLTIAYLSDSGEYIRIDRHELPIN